MDELIKEGELITDRELAAYLKVTCKKVQHMARNHEIKGIRIGRSWRFQREAIKDLLIGSSR